MMTDATPLSSAIERDDHAAVRALLDEQPRRASTYLRRASSIGDQQWMPLHVAAAAGAEAVVKLLLEAGVHPDCRTRFQTPLHARQTPLHLAAEAGHVGVVRQLLAAGGETQVFDAQRRSPLWLAAAHGHAAVIEPLFDHGSDLEARDQQGRTPLHAAIRAAGVDEANVDHGPAASTIPTPDESGAGPADAKPDQNAPPIGDQPSPHAPPARPASAAESATRPSPLTVVEVLLQLGADPNATCPKEPAGYTPLHRAVSLGPMAAPLVELLIKHHADPSARDPRHDRTAGELATHLGHHPIPALTADPS